MVAKQLLGMSGTAKYVFYFVCSSACFQKIYSTGVFSLILFFFFFFRKRVTELRQLNPALPEPKRRWNRVHWAAWQSNSWLVALVPVWWKCYTPLSFPDLAGYSQNPASSVCFVLLELEHMYIRTLLQTGSILGYFIVNMFTTGLNPSARINCTYNSSFRKR